MLKYSIYLLSKGLLFVRMIDEDGKGAGGAYFSTNFENCKFF